MIARRHHPPIQKLVVRTKSKMYIETAVETTNDIPMAIVCIQIVYDRIEGILTTNLGNVVRVLHDDSYQQTPN